MLAKRLQGTFFSSQLLSSNGAPRTRYLINAEWGEGTAVSPGASKQTSG